MDAPAKPSSNSCDKVLNPAALRTKVVRLELENKRLREALAHAWEKQCEG